MCARLSRKQDIEKAQYQAADSFKRKKEAAHPQEQRQLQGGQHCPTLWLLLLCPRDKPHWGCCTHFLQTDKEDTFSTWQKSIPEEPLLPQSQPTATQRRAISRHLTGHCRKQRGGLALQNEAIVSKQHHFWTHPILLRAHQGRTSKCDHGGILSHNVLDSTRWGCEHYTECLFLTPGTLISCCALCGCPRWARSSLLLQGEQSNLLWPQKIEKLTGDHLAEETMVHTQSLSPLRRAFYQVYAKLTRLCLFLVQHCKRVLTWQRCLPLRGKQRC